MEEKKQRGGARVGSGRKKGIATTISIKKYCEDFMIELLKNETIKKRAIKETEKYLFDESKKEDFLHIIKNEGLYKIGFTANIKRRLKDYKSHNGNVNLVYVIKSDNCFELESIIHQEYSKQRITGEWFDLSDNDLFNIISKCSYKLIN